MRNAILFALVVALTAQAAYATYDSDHKEKKDGDRNVANKGEDYKDKKDDSNSMTWSEHQKKNAGKKDKDVEADGKNKKHNDDDDDDVSSDKPSDDKKVKYDEEDDDDVHTMMKQCYQKKEAGSYTEVYVAEACGANEIPPVQTKTKALLVFTVHDGKLEGQALYYNVKDFIMSHLHIGDAKTNGPIAFWTWPTATKEATNQPLTTKCAVTHPFSATKADFVKSGNCDSFSTFLTYLKEGKIYFNVHTKAHPDGVVRGQVYLKKVWKW